MLSEHIILKNKCIESPRHTTLTPPPSPLFASVDLFLMCNGMACQKCSALMLFIPSSRHRFSASETNSFPFLKKRPSPLPWHLLLSIKWMELWCRQSKAKSVPCSQSWILFRVWSILKFWLSGDCYNCEPKNNGKFYVLDWRTCIKSIWELSPLSMQKFQTHASKRI